MCVGWVGVYVRMYVCVCVCCEIQYIADTVCANMLAQHPTIYMVYRGLCLCTYVPRIAPQYRLSTISGRLMITNGVKQEGKQPLAELAELFMW